MYWIFIIALCLIFIITYVLFRKDLFVPPVMMTLVFLCCSIVVTTRYYDWKLAEYAPGSVLLLLLGISTYILGGIIAYSLVFLSLKPYSRMNKSSDIEKRINSTII